MAQPGEGEYRRKPARRPPATLLSDDGTNPGEVVISFDAVPDATHYRIGYVNMETDHPLAKASVTGEWIEAFIYVDVSVLNFTVTARRADAIHPPAARAGCPSCFHRSHQ